MKIAAQRAMEFAKKELKGEDEMTFSASGGLITKIHQTAMEYEMSSDEIIRALIIIGLAMLDDK